MIDGTVSLHHAPHPLTSVLCGGPPKVIRNFLHGFGWHTRRKYLSGSGPEKRLIHSQRSQPGPGAVVSFHSNKKDRWLTVLLLLRVFPRLHRDQCDRYDSPGSPHRVRGQRNRTKRVEERTKSRNFSAYVLRETRGGGSGRVGGRQGSPRSLPLHLVVAGRRLAARGGAEPHSARAPRLARDCSPRLAGTARPRPDAWKGRVGR